MSPALEQAAKTYITRDALAASVRFLASDELEGRGRGSRGDQLARLYLATELEALGYEPAFANGQWQQANLEEWEDKQYHQPGDKLDAS